MRTKTINIFEIGDPVTIPLGFEHSEHRGKTGIIVGIDGDYAIIRTIEEEYFIWPKDNLE